MRFRSEILLLVAACGGTRAPDVAMQPAVDAGVKEPAPPARPEPPARRDLEWRTDEATAVAESRTRNRPMLVLFCAEWAAACHELSNVTFRDEAVRTQASKYVLLRIDATDDEAPEVVRLERKYSVVGLPTVVIIDPRGREKLRRGEYVSPMQMEEILEMLSPLP
jgi:thiol:disulfide interchange protein